MRTLSFFFFNPFTNDTSPKRASGDGGGLAALASFLANAYTIHIARSSNDAPTRRASVVLNERRRRRDTESPVPTDAGMDFLRVIEDISFCTRSEFFLEFIIICIRRFNRS